MKALSRFPAWCPECHTTDTAKYPFKIGEGTVGCQACGKVWPMEELAAKRSQATQWTTAELIERSVLLTLETEFSIDPAIVSGSTMLQKDLGLEAEDVTLLLDKMGTRYGITFTGHDEETLLRVENVVTAVQDKLGITS